MHIGWEELRPSGGLLCNRQLLPDNLSGRSDPGITSFRLFDGVLRLFGAPVRAIVRVLHPKVRTFRPAGRTLRLFSEVCHPQDGTIRPRDETLRVFGAVLRPRDGR